MGWGGHDIFCKRKRGKIKGIRRRLKILRYKKKSLIFFNVISLSAIVTMKLKKVMLMAFTSMRLLFKRKMLAKLELT